MKFILWDFDGVLMNSEIIWTEIWMKYLKELFPNFNKPFNEVHENFQGKSPDTKVKIIKDWIYPINDDFKPNVLARMVDEMKLSLTIGIDSILKDIRFSQCIATGGSNITTAKKLEVLNLNEYFSFEKNVLTTEIVGKSKPDPLVYKKAIEMINAEKENAIIVEDGRSGILAGISANVGGGVIVYTEHLHSSTKLKDISWAKKQGITKFADNSYELKKHLDDFYNS